MYNVMKIHLPCREDPAGKGISRGIFTNKREKNIPILETGGGTA
jgi:hypothetical protein